MNLAQKLLVFSDIFWSLFVWIGQQITQYIANDTRKESGQWDSVTDVDECKPLSQTNIRTYIWIPSNLLPAPFILLSLVNWSATGSQVEIRHHEPFKKTNRLSAVHQVLRTRWQKMAGLSLVSLSLFFTVFVSSAFDPCRSSLLILTYVRFAHKSIHRIQIRSLRIFSRFRAREKSGKLWAWKFQNLKMEIRNYFILMNDVDWVVQCCWRRSDFRICSANSNFLCKFVKIMPLALSVEFIVFGQLISKKESSSYSLLSIISIINIDWCCIQP